MKEELNKKGKSKSSTPKKKTQTKSTKTNNTTLTVKKKAQTKKVESTIVEENKTPSKAKNSTSKKKTQGKTSTSTNKTKKSTTQKNKIQSNTLSNNKNQSKANTELVKSTTIKKKNLNIIFDIIITIIIIAIIVLSILLYFKKKEEAKTRQELIEAVIPRKILTDESTDDQSIKNEIDELKIKYNNSDVYGILSIGSQDTSIPIVKGSDNDYYLNHSITKEDSIIGSVFVDYRHDVTSRQINIYGHNSGNYDPPLRILEKYLFNEEYFRSNPSLELKIDNKVRKYQIFSVYPAEKKSKEEHMQFDYQNEIDWLMHFERMHQRSLYKTDIVFSENDNVLVLQTCILYGKYQNKVLVVVAKEIK